MSYDFERRLYELVASFFDGMAAAGEGPDGMVPDENRTPAVLILLGLLGLLHSSGKSPPKGGGGSSHALMSDQTRAFIACIAARMANEAPGKTSELELASIQRECARVAFKFAEESRHKP